MKTPLYEARGTIVEKAKNGFFRGRLAGTDHVALTRISGKLAKLNTSASWSAIGVELRDNGLTMCGERVSHTDAENDRRACNYFYATDAPINRANP